MGNLFASIISTDGSMRVISNGLNTVQSNIANVSTPGYVKQTQLFVAQAFDLRQGLPGGVAAGELISARNEYAERTVQQRQQTAGAADQRVNDLAQIEPIFDLSPNSGISGAFSKFFQSFAQLAVSPNSAPARQNVLDRAQGVAAAFNQSSADLGASAAATDRELSAATSGVNRILDRLATYNEEFRKSFESSSDPGLDANVHDALEQLSELTNFTALKQADGSYNILLADQTPALVGSRVYPIALDTSGSQARILDAQGKDISAQFNTGRVGALLETRNTTIVSYRAELDTLAQTFADQVNNALSNGLDQSGNPPGQALFAYNGISPAATLSVNPLSASDIAASSFDAPGGNANALALAKLGSDKTINGFTFTEFYGNLAGRVGRDLSNAREESAARQSLLSQAKSLRQEVSGVSLDEEAAKLLQFQRSYQAAAKMVTVLNDLTDTLVGLIR